MMPKIVMFAGRELTVWQAERCLALLRERGVDDAWTIKVDKGAETIIAYPPRVKPRNC